MKWMYSCHLPILWYIPVTEQNLFHDCQLWNATDTITLAHTYLVANSFPWSDIVMSRHPWRRKRSKRSTSFWPLGEVDNYPVSDLNSPFFIQVQHCDQCQRIKQKFDRPATQLHPVPVPNYGWKQIGIDLVDPLPCSDKGNKYITVVTDYKHGRYTSPSV